MYDKYQMVIQHPASCPGKGSPLDKRKTFHRWQQALDKLEVCGVTLTPEQRTLVQEQGERVRQAERR